MSGNPFPNYDEARDRFSAEQIADVFDCDCEFCQPDENHT